MKNRKALRFGVQMLFGLGITYLFFFQDYKLAPNPLFTWSGWLDPWLGLVGFIQKQWPLLVVLSSVALILTLYAGRFFCGWLCPVGTTLDLLVIIKNRLHWPDFKPNPRIQRHLNYLRLAIMGCLAGLIIIKYFAGMMMNPFVLWPREIFRITSGLIPWSLGIIVLSGLLLFPRFWCRYFCPTGSLFSLASRVGKKKHIGEECRQCGLCIRKCPIQNISPDFKIGSDCLYCEECLRNCPTKCIEKQAPSTKPTNESRRDFLTTTAVGLGTLTLAAAHQQLITKPVTTGSRRWPRLLRPPGALNEEELASTCNRCGQCLQVCPIKVLIPTGLEAGLSGLWTPRFVPRRGKCILCMACGQVCSTKALAPVPAKSVRLGKPEINHTKCVAWAKETECLLCVETCPNFAIQIDSQMRPVIDLDKCNGCGSCEAHCPVEGSAVILAYYGETRRKL